MSEYSGMNDAFEMTNEDAVLHKNEERNNQGKNARKHIDEFVADSTLHGLHYCFDTQFLIRRIFWSVLILIALALVIQQLFEGANHFFKYPFFTVMTTKHVSKMAFPAVSICNLNDLRYSIMNGSRLHDMFTNTMHFNFSALDKNEYRNTIEKANHQLKSMLKKCMIKRLSCSFRNFTQYNSKEGTRCFTFNSGSPGHPLIFVDPTETNKWLELVINVEHDDYYHSTQDVGIRLILHGQGESPVRKKGILISPGFSALVYPRKRKVKNLPSPYATNCGKIDLKYFKTYSKNHCYLERLTDAVVSKCGCKDVFMPGQHRVCSLEESMNCMWHTFYNFDKQKDSCPLPCIEETYTQMVTMARYPSNLKADQIAKSLNLNGTKTANRDWIRDHFMKVRIVYDEIIYEDIEQVPAYNVMMLLGDVGGILGLFLGASILTFIEFFDCIAMLIFSRFKLFKK